MMANKEMENLLDDIMIEHIASAPVQEAIELSNFSPDEIKAEQQRFMDRVKKLKLEARER